MKLKPATGGPDDRHLLEAPEGTEGTPGAVLYLPVTRPLTFQEVNDRIPEASQDQLLIAELLWKGANASTIRKLVHTGDSKIQKVATLIDWDLTWRNISRQQRSNRKTFRTAGCLTTPEIVRLYRDEKLTLHQIGERAGVSRERVRQVLESTGHDYPTERITQRKAARQRDQEARRTEHREKMQALRRAYFIKKYGIMIELWDVGAPLTEIASKIGKTVVHTGTIIHQGRHKWGLFSYRNPPQNSVDSPPDNTIVKS